MMDEILLMLNDPAALGGSSNGIISSILAVESLAVVLLTSNINKVYTVGILANIDELDRCRFLDF